MGRRYRHRRHNILKRLWRNRAFRDFLAGTGARLMQLVFIFAGLYLVISGLIINPEGKIVMIRLVGGVICLCASFGVKYALGQIVRFRW